MAEDKTKEAVKTTLIGLVKPEVPKEKSTAVSVKAPSDVQKTEASKEIVKAPESKPEAPKEVKAEAKPDAKAEARKEADPGKEFVDAVMAEMALKGGSKKRLVKTLAEQYGFDKQRVLFKLKRALITERYAALHAEGSAH